LKNHPVAVLDMFALKDPLPQLHKPTAALVFHVLLDFSVKKVQSLKQVVLLALIIPTLLKDIAVIVLVECDAHYQV
jgi:hypothetical protein